MKRRVREFLVLFILVLACWPRIEEVAVQAQVAATRWIPRHGTTAEMAVFIGANGELNVDSTKHTVVIGDGVSPGGHPLATEAALTEHESDLANPHQVSAAQVGALATSAQAGGDASGTFAALSVIAIRGHAVAATVPSTDQFLVWDGSAWSPTSMFPGFIGAAADGVNSDLTDLQTLATAKFLGATTGSVIVKAPANGADWTLTLPADDGGVGYGLVSDGAGGSSWSASAGGGDNVSVDGTGVVDPDLVSTGDVDVVNTANTITFNLNGTSVGLAEMKNEDHGDVAWVGGAAKVQAVQNASVGPNALQSSGNYSGGSGYWNFGVGGLVIPTGADAPATCQEGMLFIDLDGNTTGTTCQQAGNTRPKLCACTALNVWKGTDLGT